MLSDKHQLMRHMAMAHGNFNPCLIKRDISLGGGVENRLRLFRSKRGIRIIVYNDSRIWKKTAQQAIPISDVLSCVAERTIDFQSLDGS